MKHDEERGRLVISVGNVTRRMSLVSTEGMADTKVPNLNLAAKVAVNVEELQRGIKASESISDHIALTATPEKGYRIPPPILSEEVYAKAVEAVKALGVRNQEALHGPAHRTVPRTHQQMDVVAHEAVAV